MMTVRTIAPFAPGPTVHPWATAHRVQGHLNTRHMVPPLEHEVLDPHGVELVEGVLDLRIEGPG